MEKLSESVLFERKNASLAHTHAKRLNGVRWQAHHNRSNYSIKIIVNCILLLYIFASPLKTTEIYDRAIKAGETSKADDYVLSVRLIVE